MSTEVILQSGKVASAFALEKEMLTLHAPEPHAPGAPVQMTMRAREQELSLQGKVIGARRLDESTFELKLRLVNFSRTARELLERLMEDKGR